MNFTKLIVWASQSILYTGLFFGNLYAQDASDRGYRLGPGDTISVNVYGEDDLSGDWAVGGNGRVNYAFVGEFQLSGKTVAQIEEEITGRLLGDYLISPRVSVSIAEYRPFFIHGEVNNPGNYPYQPGLTVRKSISIAGGLKERASKKKWYLVPENGEEDDKREVGEDDLVNPGDTITIEQSFF